MKKKDFLILTIIATLIIFLFYLTIIINQKKNEIINKLENIKPTEIPEKVGVIISRIQKTNIAIKETMDQIPAHNPIFREINMLMMKSIREGMDNGRDPYLDGKITEEQFLIQIEKAEKLMNEALEKAKKALEEIKTAPKKGGFK